MTDTLVSLIALLGPAALGALAARSAWVRKHRKDIARVVQAVEDTIGPEPCGSRNCDQCDAEAHLRASVEKIKPLAKRQAPRAV